MTTRTIKPNKPGQKPIKFKEGGLHESTGTPKGQKIPASKHAAAAAGKLGPKAKKQEQFMRNVLHGAEDGAEVDDPVKKLVKGVKDGPGKIGETVVDFLKGMGETADKAKNIPKAIEREGKGAVKKAKKLVGLSSGGLIADGFYAGTPQRSTNATSAATAEVATPATPAANTAPADSKPRAVAATGGAGGGGGGGTLSAAGIKGALSGALVTQEPSGEEPGADTDERSSNALISKGLRGMAYGGFVTGKGNPRGSKGWNGKRLKRPNGAMK